MGEIQRIVDQLKRAQDGPAWHGPSVREVLEGVTAKQAVQKPIPGAHSVWEIVLHVAVWEGVVRQRLTGERTGDDSDVPDWPVVGETTEAAWRGVLDDLARGHQRLRETIAAQPESKLSETVPGKKNSFYGDLHGIIQHDLYHAGQIPLLKKACAK